MTNMNPLRDDGLAAQERVFQLEKELAKKNELIYKLQNPEPKKPKQPRKPINWPKWFKRTAKISAWIIGGAAFLLFLVAFFESNDTYVAKGTIVKIKNQEKQYTDLCERPDKNGKIVEMTGIACGQKNPNSIFYILQVAFEDRYNGRRIIDIEHTIKTKEWTKSVPYAGCEVSVYYQLGEVFHDIPWTNHNVNTSQPRYRVDIGMCAKKADKPPAEKSDNLNPK